MALEYSEDTVESNEANSWPYIAVYNITNDTPYDQPPITAIVLNAALDKLSVTFMATAGTTYHLQFADSLGDPPDLKMEFRLIATNAPIIFEQPADQTIAPNGSALFTVLASGMNPLSYQWCSNGAPIPNATYPMLPLDNVTADQAGAYTVIVSNATGAVTSQVANLKVESAMPMPSLDLVAQTTNGFAFVLAGESGRYWRIESSTDLVNWTLENSFPSTQPILNTTNNSTFTNVATAYGNVAFMTNALVSLIVPANGAAKFVRARNYIVPNEIRNNNLKRIRFATKLWARAVPYVDNGTIPVTRLTSPTDGDLAAYGIDPDAAVCPVGGMYTYRNITACGIPSCTVPGHVLEEPQ